jgi:plastocyanin
MRLLPTATAIIALAALAPAAVASGPSVDVPGKRFVPAEVTAHAGQTVTWTFRDGGHNAFGITPGPAFDSRIGGDDNPEGTTWSHRFDRPGTYEYVCTQHGGMEGRVIVTPAPATPAAPAPPARTSAHPPATASAPASAHGAGAPAASGTAPAATPPAGPALRVLGARANRLRLRLTAPSRLVVRHVRADGPRRLRTRTLHAAAGTVRLPLDRWMKPGRHRVSVMAFDALGRPSAPVRLVVSVR